MADEEAGGECSGCGALFELAVDLRSHGCGYEARCEHGFRGGVGCPERCDDSAKIEARLTPEAAWTGERDEAGLMPWPEEPDGAPGPEFPGVDTILAAALDLARHRKFPRGEAMAAHVVLAEVEVLLIAARRQARWAARRITRLAAWAAVQKGGDGLKK